jgi:hypothetical protein
MFSLNGAVKYKYIPNYQDIIFVTMGWGNIFVENESKIPIIWSLL